VKPFQKGKCKLKINFINMNNSLTTIAAAVASQSEAMESGDHFKNGAKPKSHTSRKILK